MYHFCTYFDKNYLSRGVTLYRSLTACCEVPFRFYVLCLDQDTFDILGSLGDESIIPVRLEEVELWDEELLVAKQNRSLIEYYFTLSPVFPLYVLKHFDVDIVTYLDADLMFFSSPKAIYKELGEGSVFITKHGFSDKLKYHEKYGIFNVQCQSFRKDLVGLRCLERWREQCLLWCYDRLEDGKFADQKYLDAWPSLYGELLTVNSHPGIAVAPWNVESLHIQLHDSKVMIGDSPLVFYHFHGMKFLNSFIVKLGLSEYFFEVPNSNVKLIYRQYVSHLLDDLNDLQSKLGIKALYGLSRQHEVSKLRQLFYSIRKRDVLITSLGKLNVAKSLCHHD